MKGSSTARLSLAPSLCLSVLLAGINAPAARAQSDDELLAERATVRLFPGTNVQAFAAEVGVVVLDSIPNRQIYLLQLPSGEDEGIFEMKLENHPSTIWADLVYENEIPEGRAASFFVSGPPDSLPYLAQFAPGKIGIYPAHRRSLGRDVVVGIADTGVDATHPALVGHLLGGGWDFIDNDPDPSDVGNGVDDDGDGFVDEMVGHGTHVAGIVARSAPGAKILLVRALEGDGGGDAFLLAKALFFLVDAGVDVINLSLGSTYDDEGVSDAVEEAKNTGILMVAAGGNLARETPEEYPANDSGVVGILSVGPNDVLSTFSNFGAGLTLAAPGESIVSAIPGGGWASWSGTSMAAAWVSGAAALLASSHPTWGVNELRNALFVTALDLGPQNPGHAGLLGHGRLDAGRALLALPEEGGEGGDRASGAGWSATGAGTNQPVLALAASGENLWAGGRFTEAGGVPAAGVARWDGSAWSALGGGVAGEIHALEVFEGNLVVAGFFQGAGGEPSIRHVAAWDGSSWASLGEGMNDGIYALVTYGESLVAGGRFTGTGNGPAAHVARWDGTSWQPLGSGTDDIVLALAVLGGDLYAGGWFGSAGGNPAAHVARWDGTLWHPLGEGTNDGVSALAVYEGALAAGGHFDAAGGVSAARVARWDGAGWTPLGSGLGGSVLALESIGLDLYAAGVFPAPAGAGRGRIAGFSGGVWTALGGGLGASALDLAPHSGALAAGGFFNLAGIDSAGHVARWGPVATGVPLPSGGAMSLRWTAVEPNPFRGSVTMHYELPRPASVQLSVFNLRGERVTRLFVGERSAGSHAVRWSGTDDEGRPVGSGTYFVRIESGGVARTGKITLVR